MLKIDLMVSQLEVNQQVNQRFITTSGQLINQLSAVATRSIKGLKEMTKNTLQYQTIFDPKGNELPLVDTKTGKQIEVETEGVKSLVDEVIKVQTTRLINKSESLAESATSLLIPVIGLTTFPVDLSNCELKSPTKANEVVLTVSEGRLVTDKSGKINPVTLHIPAEMWKQYLHIMRYVCNQLPGSEKSASEKDLGE